MRAPKARRETNARPKGAPGGTVIYLVYKDGEILVETDSIEFAKQYVSRDQECSVRDARTGKKVTLE
jgi:hypothetical protein